MDTKQIETLFAQDKHMREVERAKNVVRNRQREIDRLEDQLRLANDSLTNAVIELATVQNSTPKVKFTPTQLKVINKMIEGYELSRRRVYGSDQSWDLKKPETRENRGFWSYAESNAKTCDALLDNGIIEVYRREDRTTYYRLGFLHRLTDSDFDYNWKADTNDYPCDTQIVWEQNPKLTRFFRLLLDHIEACSTDEMHAEFWLNDYVDGKWSKVIFPRTLLQPLLDDQTLVEFPNRWNPAHTVIVLNRVKGQ